MNSSPRSGSSIFQRLADDFEDGLRRPHRPLGVAEDLSGQQVGLLQNLFVWNDFHHHVALQRLLRVDRLGGEDRLHRNPDAACVDQPR